MTNLVQPSCKQNSPVRHSFYAKIYDRCPPCLSLNLSLYTFLSASSLSCLYLMCIARSFDKCCNRQRRHVFMLLTCQLFDYQINAQIVRYVVRRRELPIDNILPTLVCLQRYLLLPCPEMFIRRATHKSTHTDTVVTIFMTRWF